jgi:hypothetical protein
MNCDNARVIYMSPKEVGIRLPNITYNFTQVGFYGMMVVVERKAGFNPQISQITRITLIT